MFIKDGNKLKKADTMSQLILKDARQKKAKVQFSCTDPVEQSFGNPGIPTETLDVENVDVDRLMSCCGNMPGFGINVDADMGPSLVLADPQTEPITDCPQFDPADDIFAGSTLSDLIFDVESIDLGFSTCELSLT